MSMALDLSYGLEVVWIVLGSVMFIMKHKDEGRHDGDDINRG
ncbi:hypothetical protein [Paenibacillus dendritiformis]|nr:hypothetical protein [Paenibacillus dendritiformis]